MPGTRVALELLLRPPLPSWVSWESNVKRAERRQQQIQKRRVNQWDPLVDQGTCRRRDLPSWPSVHGSIWKTKSSEHWPLPDTDNARKIRLSASPLHLDVLPTHALLSSLHIESFTWLLRKMVSPSPLDSIYTILRRRRKSVFYVGVAFRRDGMTIRMARKRKWTVIDHSKSWLTESQKIRPRAATGWVIILIGFTDKRKRWRW